jgi:hypothetical protein
VRLLALSVALLAVAGVARAQPMMVDPSRMSGIPRPDPQVPAGTVTVRLIRGELANRLVGVDVELRDDQGAARTAKTDENGRATFSGLEGGPWVASASQGDEQLRSQPIDLPPGVGVRVMLVFPAAGAGAPDGSGKADKTVPAGTVIVRVVDGDSKPLTGVDVVLGQARAGEDQVRERKAKTDAAGEARFEGLDAKPTSGYLAEALKDGSRYSGKPFRLSENMGARVQLEVRPVTKDLSALSIAAGSHLIVEVGDDALQVAEVLKLENTGSAPVEIAGGLRLPLPDKAVSVAVGPESPPSLSAGGHEVVWKGPIPVGDSTMQLMYVLPYHGDSVELRQRTPIPFTEVAVVTEKIDGLSVVGDRLASEERELGGRPLMLLRGPGTSPGGELSLRVTGLPHNDPTWRYLAAALALAIVVGFGLYARGGEASGELRRKLAARREHLLDELVALGDDPKRQKRRDELTERLAEVYRELDEAS